MRVYGADKLSKSAANGYALVNACLEQEYVKKLTKPILDITEKSIDYLIPVKAQEKQGPCWIQSHSICLVYYLWVLSFLLIDHLESTVKSNEPAEPTTLKRFYDINKHVADRFIQTTFETFVYLNVQFDNILKKLEQLKRVVDNYTDNYKQRLSTHYETNKASLKALCSRYISNNNIPLSVSLKFSYS